MQGVPDGLLHIHDFKARISRNVAITKQRVDSYIGDEVQLGVQG